MALTPGTRLGPYEIVSAIGAGGMGEVYRAHDSRLGRDVAIKVLPDNVSRDPTALARFEREARAIGALSHPNIVAVHDVGTAADVSYVVMELLEGETLRGRLQQIAGGRAAATGAGSMAGSPTSSGSGDRRTGGLPQKKALEIASQIAQGLAAAHGKGLVHRDLKPENIFLTSDGRVKILDFGLARAVATGGESAETRASPAGGVDTSPGLVLGTVGYMAPEQVRGQPADHRADIFAFGAVLFEMLTGERAFTGDSMIEAMSAILKADPLDRPAAAVSLTPSIEMVLRHCLEKQPDERFQSARDLAFQVQAIGGSLTSGSTAPASPVAGPRSRTLAIAAVCFVAGLIAGGGIIWQWRDRPAASGPGGATVFAVDPPAGGAVANGSTTLPRGLIAVSPDGKRVAYRVSLGATSQLWVRSLDAVTSYALADTDAADYPFWSPDSRELAFCQRGKLKRVLVDGGTTQVMMDCQNPRTPGSWGTDGTILLASNYRGPLTRFSTSGGAATEVLSVGDPNLSFYSPAWLPDARHFLVVKFFYRDDPRDQAGVFLGTIGSPDLVPVVSGRIEAAAVSDGRLFFIRDGTLIAQPFDLDTLKLSGQPQPIANNVVSFSAAGGTIAYFNPPNGLRNNNRIAWFGRDGKLLSYSGDAGTYRDPRISPDGRLLAVAQGDRNGLSRIWSYDIARNAGAPVTPSSSVEPVWSPTGGELIAGSFSRPMRYSLGGGPGVELRTGNLGNILPFDWSPDGATLLMVTPDSKSLLAVEASNPTRSTVIATSPEAVRRAAFSRDGRWVAYDVTDGGSTRVFVAPFPGPGPSMPVSSVAGANPRWRRDGRELFFLGRGGQMYEVDVTPAGAALAFGDARPLFKADVLVGGNFLFDVTADGQRFVALVDGGLDRSPVTVVRNWAPGVNVK